MNIGIRSALLLGFLGVGSTLGACGGYVNLGDPSDAGAGGENDGAGGSPDTGGGAGAGSGASPASGGTAGSGGGSADAGTGGDAPEGGTGGGGSTEPPPPGSRSGPFKMLVYSRTRGFLHESITSGTKMLEAIGAEQGFDLTTTTTNEEFTLEGLSKYEIVFFLNTSGDVLDTPEEQAFEAWMTTRNGAFAGVHSATDTENGWDFYAEVTGQYFDLHGPAGTLGEVLVEAVASGFPGMAGIPNPWPRSEEWYRFNQHATWSAKPGFTILARNAADNHPVSWTREHANFRSFYTSIGHASTAFEEDLVKTHVAGGIMWAVRREHLFQE